MQARQSVVEIMKGRIQESNGYKIVKVMQDHDEESFTNTMTNPKWAHYLSKGR
jgi:hypothetical protein